MLGFGWASYGIARLGGREVRRGQARAPMAHRGEYALLRLGWPRSGQVWRGIVVSG